MIAFTSSRTLPGNLTRLTVCKKPKARNWCIHNLHTPSNRPLFMHLYKFSMCSSPSRPSFSPAPSLLHKPISQGHVCVVYLLRYSSHDARKFLRKRANLLYRYQTSWYSELSISNRPSAHNFIDLNPHLNNNNQHNQLSNMLFSKKVAFVAAVALMLLASTSVEATPAASGTLSLLALLICASYLHNWKHEVNDYFSFIPKQMRWRQIAFLAHRPQSVSASEASDALSTGAPARLAAAGGCS